MPLKEAGIWSLIWGQRGALFNLGHLALADHSAGRNRTRGWFLTGYPMKMRPAVDKCLRVLLMLFGYLPSRRSCRSRSYGKVLGPS